MALSKILPASQEQYAGARNLIINGAMQVWRRTTSVSGGSLDPFVWAADRFWMYAPSSTSGTVGQSTDVPSGEGFAYSLYNNLDTSCSVGTNVELYVAGSDAPFVNGNQYTFSFWVKGGSASTGNAISVTTRDNSAGTGSVTRASGLAFDVSTSWVRVEKTFTLSGTVGASNKCLQFELSIPVGSYITGVQLEVGETATPFEHRSYGDELARCQRYYYRIVDGNTQSIGTGTYFSSSALGVMVHYPVTMRAAPSKIVGGGTGYFKSWRNGGSDDFNGFTNFYNVGKNAGYLQGESADGVSGTAGHSALVVTNNASAYVDLDAEL